MSMANLFEYREGRVVENKEERGPPAERPKGQIAGAGVEKA
jgi:hypothetical protein